MLSCEIDVSDVFNWNYNSKADIVVNQGGTSSGKTYSILQVLFFIACTQENKIITVVGQDIPNLKVGALRDALNIVETTEFFKQSIESYNKTDRIFKSSTNSIIEFNSYDNEQDAKSGKRDYSFFNEANGIPYSIYVQIQLRTRIRSFIDYNPSEEFWVHENVIGQPNVQLFISDHRHNPFIDDKIRNKIEALKDTDYELWKVYARGLTGKIEGLIYRNYSIVQGVPDAAKYIGSGLDFGFTNDPTSLVDLYKYDNEIYLDEKIYEQGLTNPEISDRIKAAKIKHSREVYADSSEPKSIKEIGLFGHRIFPVTKGPDSIKLGIDTLKRYPLRITQNSHGLRKEIKSYKWKVDAAGKILNVPIDFNNHSLDAARYVALMKLQHNTTGKYRVV